ncbi:ATP-binding cassette domain-containing protein [Rhizobium sp. NPDC090279]|uniref:ATP-binding cassette domain-containing protein n=1 Tax=Rhizobium sp. NPDC090279 TaxID=3364499 RepID=UPI00383BD606
MLNIRNVSKVYGADHRLAVPRDVGLQLEAGEFCALTGASGSGKTTLMNLIGLIDRPTAGDIEIVGMNTSRMATTISAGRAVSSPAPSTGSIRI